MSLAIQRTGEVCDFFYNTEAIYKVFVRFYVGTQVEQRSRGEKGLKAEVGIKPQIFL